MTRLVIILVLLASVVSAELSPEQRAEHAANAAATIDTLSETARTGVMPDFGTTPPHPIPDTDAGLVDDGTLLSISVGPEGQRYQEFGAQIENWGPTAVNKDLLNAADDAVSDPDTHVATGLFTSNMANDGQCTATSYTSAPPFSAVCDRAMSLYTSSCTDVSTATADVEQRFECSDQDPNYSLCSDLRVNGDCTRESGFCLSYGQDGTCTSELETFLCLSKEPVVTVATPLGPPDWINPLVTTTRVCQPNFVASTCVSNNSTCVLGSTVAYIGDLAIPIGCQETQETYDCLGSTLSSDCAGLINGGCTLEASDCFEYANDGTCLNFEDTYSCGGGATPSPASCPAVTVCVGSTCQTVNNPPNEDFAESAAQVAGLNAMVNSKEWDISDLDNMTLVGPETVEFFPGTVAQCGVAIFATYNCCRDTGWANGVFTQCSESELQLIAAQQEDRAVYLSTYCAKRIFVCTVKRRRYCVYESKLARIFSTEGFRLLGITYECRALTYHELGQIDFSQMDLSEAFQDLADGAILPDASVLTGAIAANATVNAPVVREVYDE